MKGKHLAILLVLVVVLGGLWLLVSNRNPWSEGGGVGGKVVNFPLNDVAHITIKSPDGEVNLVKKAEVWTVQERADYPARFEAVSGLLRKLWDLKTVQEVPVGPSQLPRLELVGPGEGSKGGTLVQLTDDKGKTLAALLLGKKYLRKGENGMDMEGLGSGGTPAGRYVKPVDGAKVSLVSDSLDDAAPKAEQWISKEFLVVSNPKSITVSGATDEQKWAVSRDSATAQWKLVNAKEGETLDEAKVEALGSLLSLARIVDVLAPGAKLEDPVTHVAIETFDGFHYDLKLGKAQGENEPMQFTVSANLPKERAPGKDEKPEDKKRLDDEFTAKAKQAEEKLSKEKKLEGRTYLLPKYAVETLLRSRSDLLAPKPTPTPAPTTPATPLPVVTTSAPAAIPPVPAVTPVPTPLTAPYPVATPAPSPSPTPNEPAVATTPLPPASPSPAEQAASPTPAPSSAVPVTTPSPSPEVTTPAAPATVAAPSPTPAAATPVEAATPRSTPSSIP